MKKNERIGAYLRMQLKIEEEGRLEWEREAPGSPSAWYQKGRKEAAETILYDILEILEGGN